MLCKQPVPRVGGCTDGKTCGWVHVLTGTHSRRGAHASGLTHAGGCTHGTGARAQVSGPAHTLVDARTDGCTRGRGHVGGCGLAGAFGRALAGGCGRTDTGGRHWTGVRAGVCGRTVSGWLGLVGGHLRFGADRWMLVACPRGLVCGCVRAGLCGWAGRRRAGASECGRVGDLMSVGRAGGRVTWRGHVMVDAWDGRTGRVSVCLCECVSNGY